MLLIKIRFQIIKIFKSFSFYVLIFILKVIVVCAETGSGKTTQVPQYIFDDYISKMKGTQCNILITQPRRISAISVASRVFFFLDFIITIINLMIFFFQIAEERGEVLGNTVGYNIRFESINPNQNGSILLCTTGIVLRMLQTNTHLKNISHVILDEVHERDLNTDYLMVLIKDLILVNKSIKIILMSATINPGIFSNYFNNCPILEVFLFLFFFFFILLINFNRFLENNSLLKHISWTK